MKFIDINTLQSSIYSRKEFKGVKDNFKNVIFGYSNFKLCIIFALIIIVSIVLVVTWYCSSKGIIGFIIASKLNYKITIFACLIAFGCTIIILKTVISQILVYIIETLLIEKNLKTSREQNFLKYYCNDKKLTREEIYEYKNLYQQLNKKWQKSNEFFMEIIKTIFVIVIIIYLIIQVNPLIDTLKLQIGYEYTIDSIIEIIRYSLILLISLQTIDMRFNQFSFDVIIDYYDYILFFGYSGFEQKYIGIENN